jgi:hypothetical protein
MSQSHQHRQEKKTQLFHKEILIQPGGGMGSFAGQ